MSIPSPRLACDLPEVDPAKIPSHGDLPNLSAGVLRRRLNHRQREAAGLSQPPVGWTADSA